MRRILLALCLMGCGGSPEVPGPALPIEAPAIEDSRVARDDSEAEKLRERHLLLSREEFQLASKLRLLKFNQDSLLDLRKTAIGDQVSLESAWDDMAPSDRQRLLELSQMYVSGAELTPEQRQFLEAVSFPEIADRYRSHWQTGGQPQPGGLSRIFESMGLEKAMEEIDATMADVLTAKAEIEHSQKVLGQRIDEAKSRLSSVEADAISHP